MKTDNGMAEGVINPLFSLELASGYAKSILGRLLAAVINALLINKFSRIITLLAKFQSHLNFDTCILD